MRAPPLPSIADIFRTIFIVFKKYSERQEALAVLMTPSPSLNFEEICGYKTISPGMYKGRWTPRQAKRIIALLRDLGYKVIVYDHANISQWFASVEELVEVKKSSDFDLHLIAKKLPKHHTYVEVFGGGAPMILAKEPAKVEVYNDTGSFVVEFFQSLRDIYQFNWFFLMSRLFSPETPLHPIQIRNFIRDCADGDSVVRAYVWYCYARPVFQIFCEQQDPEYLVNQLWLLPPWMEEELGIKDLDVLTNFKRALEAVDPFLVRLHARLFRIQYENGYWDGVIGTFDSEETFFWIDPPDYGPYSLDLFDNSDYDGFDTLLKQLEGIKGSAAIYWNRQDGNQLINKRLDYFMDLGNGWERLGFPNSEIFLKT